MAYLTLQEFADRTLLAPIRLEEVEAIQPGWIANQLAFYSDLVNSRLRKRYAVPFAAMPSTPPVIQLWLTALVQPMVALKAGIPASDEQFEVLQAQASLAQAQITEAAEHEKGLFELPLTANGPEGVTRRSPKAYSEASPYTWRTLQGRAGRAEDGSI